MIVTFAELQLMLGISSTITEEERAVLALLHSAAEGRVKTFLGYDPEQRAATEYYPRHDLAGGTAMASSLWDVDTAHTQARLAVTLSTAFTTLQLERIPIRSIASVYVDSDARFGMRSGAFAAGDLWTDGEDYWAEWDQDNVCRSGMLHSFGSWTVTPGSIKVAYTAGYSKAELQGQATVSSSSDVNGQITTAYVDASPISRAVAILVSRMMNSWAMTKKNTATGWWLGPLTSERAGDYSYTRAVQFVESLIAGDMSIAAIDALESFRHWGVMRT